MADPDDTVAPAPATEEVDALVRGGDELGGRYELKGTIGRGGMGEVLEALDRRLRRDVAVKLLRRNEQRREDARRFVREAQVTSRLDHPSVVPLYELGSGPDGALFFSMKRLRGRTLAELVRRREGSRLARLDMFLRVCDAVVYAHAQGVLHRDVKPSNVFVGDFREVYLLDWGIAKHMGADDPTGEGPAPGVEAEEPVTSGGSVLGTPGFMSPEQGRGEHATLDVRTDVYSLGAVLYVLLTNRNPFPGKGREAVDQAIAGRFAPPRRVDRSVPWELDRVVCKAMATRREDRYPDVASLRAEVERFLEGVPLAGVRYGPLRRLVKWGVRNRRPLGVAGLAAWTAGGVALVVLVSWLASVSAARDRALLAERGAQRALAEGDVSLAAAQAELGRLEDALASLDRAEVRFRDLGEASRRVELTRATLAQRFPPPELTLLTSACCWRLAVSPAGDRALVSGADALEEYDLPAGHLRWRAAIPEGHEVAGVGYLGADPVVVSYGGAEAVVARLPGLTPVAPAIGIADLTTELHAEFAHDGAVVVLSGPGRGIRGYALPDGTPVGPAIPSARMSAVSGSGRLAAGAVEGPPPLRSLDALVVWDLATGDEVYRTLTSAAAALSADGRALFVDDGARQLSRVDLADGTVAWTVPTLAFARMQVTADDARLWIVGEDHRMQLRDAATGAVVGERRIVSGPSASWGHAAASRDGARVVTCGTRARADVWSLGPGADDGRLVIGLGDPLTTLAISPDGVLAATGGGDGVVRLFDWRSGSPLGEVALGPRSIRDLVFSDSGASLLVGGRDGKATLVDVAALRVVRRLTEPGANLAAGVAFRGADPVVVYDAGRIAVYDRESGERVAWMEGSIALPWSAVRSPDGRWLLVTSRDRLDPVAELWDLRAERRVWSGPIDLAGYRAAFAPDGRRVAVGTHEGRVLVFDVDGAGVPHTAVLRKEAIQGVGISPDGTLLAVGGYDGQLDFYDADSFRPLQGLRVHQRSLVDLAFTPDGTLLTVSGDGRMGTVDPLRAARLEGTWRVVREGEPAPAADAAFWLARATGDALRGNWPRVGEALDRAEALGAVVDPVERGRAAWASGDGEAARRWFDEALAAGAGPSVRLWRDVP